MKKLLPLTLSLSIFIQTIAFAQPETPSASEATPAAVVAVTAAGGFFIKASDSRSDDEGFLLVEKEGNLRKIYACGYTLCDNNDNKRYFGTLVYGDMRYVEISNTSPSWTVAGAGMGAIAAFAGYGILVAGGIAASFVLPFLAGPGSPVVAVLSLAGVGATIGLGHDAVTAVTTSIDNKHYEEFKLLQEVMAYDAAGKRAESKGVQVHVKYSPWVRSLSQTFKILENATKGSR